MRHVPQPLRPLHRRPGMREPQVSMSWLVRTGYGDSRRAWESGCWQTRVRRWSGPGKVVWIEMRVRRGAGSILLGACWEGESLGIEVIALGVGVPGHCCKKGFEEEAGIWNFLVRLDTRKVRSNDLEFKEWNG